jgi:hypothetical protein
MADDLSVDDDIQLDTRQIDEIFSRSLNKGAKKYLDRLELITSRDLEIAGDECTSLTAGFEGMRKFVNQKKNGYQNIRVADFLDFGVSNKYISKLRYLVHQLDTASPRQSVNRNFSISSRRTSAMTANSVQDDCDDYYEDDFEENDTQDDENYRCVLYLVL